MVMLLINTDFRWEVLESSTSSPSLLLKCGLEWLPIAVHFPPTEDMTSGTVLSLTKGQNH